VRRHELCGARGQGSGVHIALFATALARGHGLQHAFADRAGDFVDHNREDTRARISAIERAFEDHAGADLALPREHCRSEIVVERGRQFRFDDV
jgi:hypothetical protein